MMAIGKTHGGCNTDAVFAPASTSRSLSQVEVLIERKFTAKPNAIGTQPMPLAARFPAELDTHLDELGQLFCPLKNVLKAKTSPASV